MYKEILAPYTPCNLYCNKAMDSIDIFFLIILGIAFVSGLFKGFVRQLASLLALIAGMCVSYFWADKTLNFLQQLDLFSAELLRPASFIITFLITVLAVNFVAHLILKGINTIGLGSADKLMGAIFSVSKWVLLLSIILNLYQSIDQKGYFLSEEKRKKSYLYSPIQKVLPLCFPYVKEYLSQDNLFTLKFIDTDKLLNGMNLFED
ncbi:MAG: CvpA family protein [Bacteroidales bacterium]